MIWIIVFWIIEWWHVRYSPCAMRMALPRITMLPTGHSDQPNQCGCWSFYIRFIMIHQCYFPCVLQLWSWTEIIYIIYIYRRYDTECQNVGMGKMGNRMQRAHCRILLWNHTLTLTLTPTAFMWQQYWQPGIGPTAKSRCWPSAVMKLWPSDGGPALGSEQNDAEPMLPTDSVPVDMLTADGRVQPKV